MAIIRATWAMPYLGGAPSDRAVNAWHFTGDLSNGDAGAIQTALSAFYSGLAAGQAFEIDSYLSNQLSRTAGAVEFRAYNAEAPAPNPPFYVSTNSLNGVAPGSSIPLDCAVALSYKATYTTDGQNDRKRGRIFLGPMADAALDNTNGKVDSAFIDDLVIAAEALRTSAVLAAAGVVWVVYSRTAGASYPVVSGWVDNEFDTMRSRGLVGTKTVWP